MLKKCYKILKMFQGQIEPMGSMGPMGSIMEPEELECDLELQRISNEEKILCVDAFMRGIVFAND